MVFSFGVTLRMNFWKTPNYFIKQIGFQNLFFFMDRISSQKIQAIQAMKLWKIAFCFLD